MKMIESAPGVFIEALQVGAVKIVCSPYVPLEYPSRWEMWRWRWWWRFWGRPKPEPVEQILVIDGLVVVLPRTFELLKAAFAARGGDRC